MSKYGFGRRPTESKVTQRLKYDSGRHLAERKVQRLKYEEDQKQVDRILDDINRDLTPKPLSFIDGLIVGVSCGVLVPVMLHVGARYWGVLQ